MRLCVCVNVSLNRLINVVLFLLLNKAYAKAKWKSPSGSALHMNIVDERSSIRINSVIINNEVRTLRKEFMWHL